MASPAAPPTRYEVKPEVAEASESPYKSRSSGGAKFCRAPSTSVEKKKKLKANHVRRSLIKPRRPISLPRRRGDSGIIRSADNSRRFHQSVVREAPPMRAAAKPAARQPNALAVVVITSGLKAHPKLPERPCTEKACPKRGADTR